MPTSKSVRFFLSLLLGAVILQLFTFDEVRLSVTRAEKALNAKGFYSSPALANCQGITTYSASKEETLFLRRFPGSLEKGNASCRLSVVTARYDGLWRGTAAFALQVFDSGQGLLAEERVTVGYPKPLTLLPLLALAFAILFGLPVPSPFLLCGLYLFLLSATSVIQTLRIGTEAVKAMFTGDSSLWGTLLLLLWAIWRYRWVRRTDAPPPTGPRLWMGRGLSLISGLWNPTLFSLLGRFVLNSRSATTKVTSFLWLQNVVGAVSLYLFLGAIFRFNDAFLKSLFLPRYFSFLLIFAFIFFRWRERRDSLSLSLPVIVPFPGVMAVGLIEGMLWFFHVTSPVPTLLRIGIVLCLFELPFLRQTPFRTWFRPFSRIAALVLLSYFVIPMGELTGTFDLAFTLVDPALHPNNQVFFTFVASLLVGALSGSFAFAFFTLGELLIGVPQNYLIRAAVLDGCLLGVLLSPFSAWNLIPLGFSRQAFGPLLAARFRTLRFAAGGAFIIYSIDVLKTVGILRPLTFVSVLMMGLALELRRNRWQLPFSSPENA